MELVHKDIVDMPMRGLWGVVQDEMVWNIIQRNVGRVVHIRVAPVSNRIQYYIKRGGI